MAVGLAAGTAVAKLWQSCGHGCGFVCGIISAAGSDVVSDTGTVAGLKWVRLCDWRWVRLWWDWLLAVVDTALDLAAVSVAGMVEVLAMVLMGDLSARSCAFSCSRELVATI